MFGSKLDDKPRLVIGKRENVDGAGHIWVKINYLLLFRGLDERSLLYDYDLYLFRSTVGKTFSEISINIWVSYV